MTLLGETPHTHHANHIIKSLGLGRRCSLDRISSGFYIIISFSTACLNTFARFRPSSGEIHCTITNLNTLLALRCSTFLAPVLSLILDSFFFGLVLAGGDLLWLHKNGTSFYFSGGRARKRYQKYLSFGGPGRENCYLRSGFGGFCPFLIVCYFVLITTCAHIELASQFRPLVGFIVTVLCSFCFGCYSGVSVRLCFWVPPCGPRGYGRADELYRIHHRVRVLCCYREQRETEKKELFPHKACTCVRAVVFVFRIICFACCCYGCSVVSILVCTHTMRMDVPCAASASHAGNADGGRGEESHCLDGPYLFHTGWACTESKSTGAVCWGMRSLILRLQYMGREGPQERKQNKGQIKASTNFTVDQYREALSTPDGEGQTNRTQQDGI